MRRSLSRCLILAALVVSLASSSSLAAEQACQCHDRPNEPCVQEDLYLEHIVFPPASESVFRRSLDEEASSSEVWLLVQVIPNGACKDCEQTYLAYFPNLDTDSPNDVAYYINPETRGASDHVFSMIECSPRSGYTVAVAMIEDEGTYASDFERLSGFLSPALLLAESGNAARTDARAWSVRLQGAWLSFLFDLLNDGTNEIVLCPTAITPPSPSSEVAANYASPIDITYQQVADCDPDRKEDCAPEDGQPSECTGKVSFWMGARSMVVTPCSLRCAPPGPKDTPTQAENHFAGRERCHLVSVVASLDSDGSQYSLRQTGQPGVPTNAKLVEMTTKRYTRTEPDGSTVQFVQVVQVIQFSDGSTYVASYARKTVTKNGKTVHEVTDCVHSAFLSGYDVARLSALLEERTETEHNYTVWGGSPSGPLEVPTDLMALSGALPNRIELVASAGALLDLTSLSGASVAALATPILSAQASITIRADAIELQEGATLATLMDPDPAVLPAATGLLIVVPDVVPISAQGDTLFVLVVNRSPLPDTVILHSADTLEWVEPETTELYLMPGQAAAVALHTLPDQMSATSALALTATGMQSGAVDAREIELVVLGGEAVPSPTAAAPTLPQDVQAWARSLAWKGGYLGRTDAAQRWDAAENDPALFCEPCGHTPMCIVCMEWDLGQWQSYRQKSLSDLVALLGLMAYLASVRGAAAYDALAAIYWDSHWDGWHNRERPW